MHPSGPELDPAPCDGAKDLMRSLLRNRVDYSADMPKPYTQGDLDWADAAFRAAAEQVADEIESDDDDTAEWPAWTDEHTWEAEPTWELGPEPTVDAILHAGSDPRFCACEPCVWERTRRFAEEEARRGVPSSGWAGGGGGLDSHCHLV